MCAETGRKGENMNRFDAYVGRKEKKESKANMTDITFQIPKSMKKHLDDADLIRKILTVASNQRPKKISVSKTGESKIRVHILIDKNVKKEIESQAKEFEISTSLLIRIILQDFVTQKRTIY